MDGRTKGQPFRKRMNSNELLEGQHAWQLDALDNSVPMVESQLRLLTLNCWYVSPARQTNVR